MKSGAEWPEDVEIVCDDCLDHEAPRSVTRYKVIEPVEQMAGGVWLFRWQHMHWRATESYGVRGDRQRKQPRTVDADGRVRPGALVGAPDDVRCCKGGSHASASADRMDLALSQIRSARRAGPVTLRELCRVLTSTRK